MRRQRVRRLALSYLAVIMTLSLVFSVIIYAITSIQLNRPLPPGRLYSAATRLIERQFQSPWAAQPQKTRGSMITGGAERVMLLVWLLAGVLLATADFNTD